MRKWCTAKWVKISLFMMLMLMGFTAVITGVKYEYVFAQICMHICLIISLQILSGKPLINPIQIVVFIFYWWFGIAPIVTSSVDLFVFHNMSQAIYDQESGMESLWIVSIGILLYSIIANWVIKQSEGKNKHYKFLIPKDISFKSETLIIYLSLGGFAIISIKVLGLLGLQGIEEVNFLGGTKTNIWWIGILNAFTKIYDMATVGVIVYICRMKKKSSKLIIFLATIIIIQTLISALTSGSKTTLMLLFFYFIISIISIRQRPPFKLIFILLLIYIFILEPFVTTTRIIAQQLGAKDSQDREEIFSQVLKESSFLSFQQNKQISIGNIFRGIYPLAGSITKSNSFFDGYWKGYTIGWGIIINLPRQFYPNKPDADIGNYFSRTVGVSTGVSTIDNKDLNLAISIPFEIVGNYGWIPGILSFVFIGYLWSLLICKILSPERLANHPLTPFFCYLAITFESPFGNVLAEFRDIIFPLLILYIVWIYRKKTI